MIARQPKQKTPSAWTDRVGGRSSRPRLAIPCRVAPQQSPTLFHQTFVVYQRAARRADAVWRNEVKSSVGGRGNLLAAVQYGGATD